jgi:hypothetical protein
MFSLYQQEKNTKIGKNEEMAILTKNGKMAIEREREREREREKTDTMSTMCIVLLYEGVYK